MSLLARISPATAISLGIALVAVAGILASSGMVLTKDYPPRLAVEVHGVPGYVYYDRDYPVTIEYANIGREAAPSASVSAIIPAGFTLDGVTHATSDEPQRFVWNIGDLASGQRGEITAKLRGVLPKDLTDAVYDLPGYVGHTAFVDGFEMKVALTSSGAAVTRTATADTGATACSEPAPGCFFFRKSTGLDDGTVFDFSVSIGGGSPATIPLEDGQSFGVPIPAFPNTILVIEQPEPGWVLQGEASCDGNGVIIDTDGATITVTDNPESTVPPSGGCTFTNVPACNSLANPANCLFIIKETIPSDGTSFEFAANVAGVPQPNFFLEDGEFQGFAIPQDPTQVIVVSEFGILGWAFISVSCPEQSGVTVIIPPATASVQVARDPQATGLVAAVCTFINEEVPEPTPEPTVQPSPTPRATAQPNLGGGLGGLFAGQPTALPTARPATAPAATAPAITPPRTGDGGLK